MNSEAAGLGKATVYFAEVTFPVLVFSTDGDLDAYRQVRGLVDGSIEGSGLETWPYQVSLRQVVEDDIDRYPKPNGLLSEVGANGLA